jgi:hypothetical protein
MQNTGVHPHACEGYAPIFVGKDKWNISVFNFNTDIPERLTSQGCDRETF